ncbi:hypothetical protein ACC755_22960 [Rhizobium ruizarguesonis]
MAFQSLVQIFRDYVVDGVSSSGKNKPKKSDLRSWGAWIESIVTAFTSTGGLIYSSLALLNADLAHGANSMAWVIGDATVANNGVYRKNGASGSGSWTRLADLPYSFVKLADAGAGTPNAIQLTSSIPTSASVLRIANIFEANAGNVTISENGDAAKSLLTNSGNQIAPGGLLAGMMIAYIDNGSAFRLINDQVSAAIVAAAEAAQAAAEGARDDAEAAAVAAIAAAAGVSLPAVAANRMLVDNAAGTARESKTFSQVMTLLAGAVSGVASTFSLDNNTLYKARSLKDRWLDSYRLAEELQFTGGGATATDAAVLQALFNRAKAAGRGEIILPRGDIALEAAVSIFEPGTQPIRIVGQGPNQTRFKNTAAAQKFFNIGDAAQTRTRRIVFEGLQLYGAVAQNNTGRGFYVRNASDITFKDVLVESLQNGWSLGEGASATNDAVYISLQDCGGTSPGTSAIPIIILGSGSRLSIGGGAYRWNASGGHDFIQHVDTSWNWDGFYLSGQFFEHFAKYLRSTGKGIVNLDWTCEQLDRADVFFQAEAVAGGINRDWSIHNTKLYGFSGLGGGIGFLSSGPTENISIENCQFITLSDAAIYASSGEIYASGNKFIDCAYLGASAPSGGAIIRVGQGFARITNNVGRRSASSPGVAYRYGIQWDGASFATRSTGPTNSNAWYNFGAAAETGTM